MTYDAPSFDDETAVLGFFEAMEKGLAKKVVGDATLGLVERDGIRFAVLASPQLAALPPALLDGCEAAGLPIGVVEDDGFHLDLQGAALVAVHTKAQTIRVSEQSARLFLYGRNVLGDSILWHDAALQRGDACIVCNGRGESLGLGVVVGSFKGPRHAVKPVQDLGTYLRDQDE
jgi:NOL1/NOP2/fmu family ribosome biogenesis protein